MRWKYLNIIESAWAADGRHDTCRMCIRASQIIVNCVARLPQTIASPNGGAEKRIICGPFVAPYNSRLLDNSLTTIYGWQNHRTKQPIANPVRPVVQLVLLTRPKYRQHCTRLELDAMYSSSQ